MSVLEYIDVRVTPAGDNKAGVLIVFTFDILLSSSTTFHFSLIPPPSFTFLNRLYGFKYHRAEDDVAHLLLWLPRDIENNVPIFATHHCGVAGAIVVPDKQGGKILVVKEKNKDTWKLPGFKNLFFEFELCKLKIMMTF